MTSNKISIIVPVYNVEDFLPRCIDSILNQTYSNFELILINDGSTDKSGEMCDFYASKDNRIKVIHKINGGVSSARNRGLDNSTGDWITFVDADDYIVENSLEYALEQNIKYETDICISWDGITSKPAKSLSIVSKEEALKSIFSLKFPTSLCLGLYNKKVIENERLDEGIHHWEDYEFQTRVLFNADSICLSDKHLYNYMYRDGSANNRDINEKVISCLLIPGKNKNILRSYKYNNKTINNIYNDSTAFFTSQVVFYLLKSKKVETEYFNLIQKHCRINLPFILKSRNISNKYKAVIMASSFNIRLVYRILKNKYK
mgnify:CR=1 FL=1